MKASDASFSELYIQLNNSHIFYAIWARAGIVQCVFMVKTAGKGNNAMRVNHQPVRLFSCYDPAHYAAT